MSTNITTEESFNEKQMFQTLQTANIKVITGIEGKVKDVYEKFKSGDNGPAAEGPTVESHSGLK